MKHNNQQCKSLPSIGNDRMGVVVKRVLSYWKLFWHFFVHSNGIFFLVKLVNLVAIEEKFLKKLTIIVSESHKTPIFCHITTPHPILNRFNLWGYNITPSFETLFLKMQSISTKIHTRKI